MLYWQVCELPNEKEAVYRALDKWTAWETEFPLIAVAKALKILRKRGLWVRVIQVRSLLFYRIIVVYLTKCFVCFMNLERTFYG